MEPFVSYIEEMLHVTAEVTPFEERLALPLYLEKGYNLVALVVQGVSFLLVFPRETGSLTYLRQHVKQIEKITGYNAVLCLASVRSYTRDKLLSEGIPFIIPGKQLYMPFLGIALSNKASRHLPQRSSISPMSQKLLLTAIYQGWADISLTNAADSLAVSKMTITRCYDELEAMGLSLIRYEGKRRNFVWGNTKRQLWETVFPFLRSPVIRQYQLESRSIVGITKLGGISALCHYSMLADNPYPTFAVNPVVERAAGLRRLSVIPADETPGMLLQVLSYDLAYGDDLAIDPLSAILSLSAEDISDPRVAMAIDEVLEALPW
ncbi:MAG: hypothetical protein FWE76_04240 [Symbiobacteriaceae bacterium]|nr:hypothetical protein [Symbiobacteriaceae bacterium]